uniref:non-specific serine/threonine protein kinase n=1 Tax=Anopheles farauti TaxID=69004 RepID=A0A182QFK9_9DIPT
MDHAQQDQQSRMVCDEDEEKREVKMQSEEVAAISSSRKKDGATDTQKQEQTLTSNGGKYVLHGKIDRGTFSTVMLASLASEQHLAKNLKKWFAIKMITPTSHPARVKFEAWCLKRMGGRNNVISTLGGFRENDKVGLVMPFIQHEPFHRYCFKLGPAEVQRYLQELLIALDWVHQHGVIHRDVKPGNFLRNSANGGSYMLVDFGLAQEMKESALRQDMEGCLAKTKVGDAVATTATAAVPCTDATLDDQVVPQQSSVTAVRKPLKLSNSMKTDLTDVPLACQIKTTADTIGKHLQPKYRSSARARSPYANYLKRGALGGACCNCCGRPQVCCNCLVKPEMNAPRAGTPGYRAPEVLMRYPHQTTAIDVWAAGIIFLSLLSKVYPFFTNSDDSISLAEIIEVFGYERLDNTARALDRMLLIDKKTTQGAIQPLSLRSLCQHFRQIYVDKNTKAPVEPTAGGSSPRTECGEQSFDSCSNCYIPLHKCVCLVRDRNKRDEYGPDAYDLLGRLLEPNPHLRITAAEALQHPYFQVQY